MVQGHAVDTYGQFLDQNEEALKQLPPPAVALEYYKANDMYLFDALHKDGGLVNPRRPSCKYVLRTTFEFLTQQALD